MIRHVVLAVRTGVHQDDPRALDLTPHTVRFHLRNIYLKLGVSERDQALARWRELQGVGGRQA